MTLDELRLRIRQICEDAAPEQTWLDYDSERSKIAREKLGHLLEEHRDEVFDVAKRLAGDWSIERTPEEREEVRSYFAKWSQFEKQIAEGLPQEYGMIRRRAIAFFTCSCGSRVDSCQEDGDGNFSTFIFTSDGSVFRHVEKKQ